MNRVILDMSAEERVELAKDYFKLGYNCCQSVVMAFRDLCEVDEDSLRKLCVGLGGGVGRMREVCGCVCGMAVLSGFITENKVKTSGEASQVIRQQKAESYTLVQKFAADFKKETGSIICRELLGLGSVSNGPVPEPRTEEYYRKRPCPDMVALAVRIVSKELGSGISSEN